VTWDGFFTAEVGASAALAGLIFVGISINLQRIVALPIIANRAIQSLIVLLGALGVLSLLLVPDQGDVWAGLEVIGVAVALLVLLNRIEWSSWRTVDPQYRRAFRAHSVEIQLPAGFYLIAGLSLVFASPAALYWFVPATLISFVFALAEAWVITVEIVR
jgi:hypothetical protein